MARKGNITWEVKKEERVESIRSVSTDEVIELPADEQYTRIIYFALREDGVLLRQLVTRTPSKYTGEIETHYFGWKIYSRKPKANVYEILTKAGYC